MKRKEKGFTLIELLVAMAILGLLIGLLIPGIAIVRRGARNTARRTGLQAIEAAIEDHYGIKRKYPETVCLDTEGCGTGSTVLIIDDEEVIDPQFTIASSTTSCSEHNPVLDTEFYFTYETVDSGYRLEVCTEPKGDAYEILVK